MAKVLIVDDDSSIQYIFEQVLSLYGFEIVGIANNGEEAVSLFKSLSDKPDVILMDYRMPVKNGIEATKEILQINHNTKIIFTSADNSIREEALSIGAKGFQDKPFKIKELIVKIQRVIET